MASRNGISGLLNLKIHPLVTGASAARLACLPAHRFLATAMVYVFFDGVKENIV